MDKRKKPEWLKIRPPSGNNFHKIKDVISKYNLSSVCQEAHCPNTSECWSSGTATFMLLGDICTRACRFCAVKTGLYGRKLDHEEPEKLAKVAGDLGLDYLVLTSVNRDDLEDGGAGHFASCIKKIKIENPDVIVEALIPDFSGDINALKKVIDAEPEVIGHNIETIKELQSKVRDRRASYNTSLKVLKKVKKIDSRIYTKSSLMLGLGESMAEVINTMKDLRKAKVDFLTLGQYLRPSIRHLEVAEYISPATFEDFKKKGEEMGFLRVVAGPFVRSSYKAGINFKMEVPC